MNLNIFFTKILLAFIIIFSNTLFAQVSISPDKSKADTSAMLDVSSTKKGILIPRLALTDIGDITTIPEPANSLLVYNTSENLDVFPLGPGYYCNTGNPGKANWVKLLNDGDKLSSTWLTNGNDNINNSNFIGTIDEKDVIFKGNSIEALRISKGATLLAGNYSDVIDDVVPASGPGIRLMWLPARYAFRAGMANNTEWDLDNIGAGSFAFGSNVKASKSNTIAMGYQTTAAAEQAVAMGNGTQANGNNSFAIGALTIADGYASTALGFKTNAKAAYSLTAGNASIANAVASVAMGVGTYANTVGSFAVGRYNKIVNQTNNPNVLCTDTIFQIGNGSSEGSRSDALWVTRKGDLFVRGAITAAMLGCPSDIRLKEDIRPLHTVLENINNIQPISYYFKDKNNYPASHQIGFSAQEIEKQFPELVNKNEQGYLSVNYPQMSAVAIQAIKEQQQQIEMLQQSLTAEKKSNMLQQQLIQKLSDENDDIRKSMAELKKMILNK